MEVKIIMIAEDFEYAGEYLKDWGCIICRSNTPNSFETIDNISQLTFDQISQFNGKRMMLTTSHYDDRIEINFQICKFRCPVGVTAFSSFELHELKRWLNRPGYHKFKLLQPEWSDYYMIGSFNINELQVTGVTYLLDLTFISNSSLAFHEPVYHKFQLRDTTNTYTLFDTSDEIGYIYPDLKIICLESGKLELYNSNENRKTIIENCSANEVINFSENLVFSSSNESHKIQNDFNYIFFRIANSYGNRKNIISSSIPVDIEFSYSPYVKVVV